MDMFTICENLWQDIIPFYKADIPVFLVGHGVGGLVIKGLVVKMEDERKNSLRSDEDQRKLDTFLKNVKDILYYSTPFLGSDLANYLHIPQSTSSLLDDTTVLNKQMCRINETFSRWKNDRRECRENMVMESLVTQVVRMHIYFP
jgi:hypothetical protein